MKPALAGGLCTALLAAVVTSGPVAAQTRQPLEGLPHPPMQAYRNPDGSIRHLRNSIVTGYWSGYAVTASAPYWVQFHPAVWSDRLSSQVCTELGEHAAVHWSEAVMTSPGAPAG
jgi:hypothetical protein